MSEPWIRGSTFSSLLTPPINNGNGSSSSSSNVITLPQMLEKYSSIYNTNGRIGIYTREVPLTILLSLNIVRREMLLSLVFMKNVKKEFG